MLWWVLLRKFKTEHTSTSLYHNRKQTEYRRYTCPRDKIGIDAIEAQTEILNYLETHPRLVTPYYREYQRHWTKKCMVEKFQPYSGSANLYLTFKIKLDSVIALALDVIEALDYMHSKGIAHRNIKPSNILFRSGNYYLGDLQHSQRNMRGRKSTGTIGYAAPEVYHATALETPLHLRPLVLPIVPKYVLAAFPNIMREPVANINYDYFKADVYSLGATLKAISKHQSIVDLANTMTHNDPDERPTLAQVKQRLKALQ